MVAFLGAVICIIAAVHPGFISAAPQAFSDNESLSHDSVLETLPEGSMAQPGPLGALHGAETTEGIGASVVNGLSNSGRAGSGERQQVTFNRLICTPVPTGECNPKTFLKPTQTQGPPLHSDEDWSYLSATAKQLQETILQQKDQILSDQQTIQELTGKLSECEIGLGERSYPGRSAGLWGNRRRLLAGNGHMSPVVPDQQSTHVLEELEQAIIQMKDRIEKLESDTPPTSQNHTGAPQKGQGGLPASRGTWTKAPSRRPQDKLGGKLEAKVQQLEEERVMLNGEAKGRQEEAPEDADSLWRSIDRLEQSLSGYNFPESYKLLFPVRTDYMYGVVRHPIPEMYAMTACLWLRPKGSGLGTPFSYSIPEQPNELVLLQGVHNPVEILINDKVAQLPLVPQPGKWQHLCVTWSLRDGVWQAYQGGTLKGEGEGLAAWHPIRPGGMLILGQEQDAMGGRFDASQAMVGELSQFNLWDRVLSPSEVADLATCSSALLGNVVPWTNRGIDVFGGGTKEPAEPCTERIGAQ